MTTCARRAPRAERCAPERTDRRPPVPHEVIGSLIPRGPPARHPGRHPVEPLGPFDVVCSRLCSLVGRKKRSGKWAQCLRPRGRIIDEDADRAPWLWSTLRARGLPASTSHRATAIGGRPAGTTRRPAASFRRCSSAVACNLGHEASSEVGSRWLALGGGSGQPQRHRAVQRHPERRAGHHHGGARRSIRVVHERTPARMLGSATRVTRQQLHGPLDRDIRDESARRRAELLMVANGASARAAVD